MSTSDEDHMKLVIGDASDQKGMPIDEIYENLGFGVYQQRMTIVIGGAMACDYMEVQLLAFIQGCVIQSLGDDNVIYESILTSAVFAGQVVGMLTLGPLADYYGRRPIILLGWLFIVLFGLLSCLSPDIYFLIIARALVGVGIGASQAIAYDLFAEIIPPQYRARLIFLNYVGLIGQIYLISIAWMILSTAGWRWLSFAAAIPILIIFISGYYTMLESPRWLLSQGRVKEAEALLHQINIMNGSPLAVIEVRPLHNTEKEDATIEALFSPPFTMMTILLWAVWALGYFSYYCVYLVLVSTFEDKNNACDFEYGYIMLSAFMAVIGITAAFIGVDKFGRSVTLSMSFFISALFLLAYFLCLVFGHHEASVALLLFGVASSVSALTAIWIFTAESYPTNLRGTGHSMANILGRVGAFLSVYWIDDFEKYHVLPGTAGFIVSIIITAIIGSLIKDTSKTALVDHIDPNRRAAFVTSPISRRDDEETKSLLG
eukprot:gene18110-23764_t